MPLTGDSEIYPSRKQVLFFAARDGMTKMLVSSFEDVPQEELMDLLEGDMTDSNGQCACPLIIAAKYGHNMFIKVLLSKFKVNIEKEGCVRIDHFFIEGATALWCAAGAGHLNVVKTLVNAGADVNHTTANNSTPVRAACYDGRLDIVKYLVSHGADVNIPNKYNNTCLMIASYKGHIDIVRYLLEQNVNPNQQAQCGATALLFAAECGHIEVVKELIKYGAQCIPTKTGITPVMAAAERTREYIVEYLVMKCKLSIFDQINCFELLGASFANDKENYCLGRAYLYLCRAMKLRYSGPVPILKIHSKPIPAYDNWIECQTLEEIQALRNNDALHMEALAIRERLLGQNNPEVTHNIIYRGAVFADDGRFDRCIALWLRALEISQNCKESLVKDLRRFSQIFCQMVHDSIELQFSVVAYILEVNYMELERNKSKLELAVCKDEIIQLKDDIENNVVTALYLIVIISRMLEYQGPEDVFKIHQLVFRINKMKLHVKGGQTLLHLCVNPETPVGNFHTSSICRFPCAITAKLLIKCGADINALDNDKNTPLHTIVSYLKPLSDFATLHSIIKELVDAGAHMDIVNNRGETPLDSAATGVAEIILRSQVKVSLQCLAARVVVAHGMDYKNNVPVHLIPFIDLHGPNKTKEKSVMY